MGERQPKNNEESSKSKREGNLGFLVRFLTGDRWDFLDEQETQALCDRAEEIFLDLTWEEQEQLWRLVQREELQRVQRDVEEAREHLHDIIIGGIRERISGELTQEVLERRRRRELTGHFVLRWEMPLEDEIRSLEKEKAEQSYLEEELLRAKQRQEGSRSHPPDETILPPPIRPPPPDETILAALFRREL